MREGMGQHLTTNEKYGKLGRDFCSGYNTHTLFQNLQKRSFVCSECGTLQARYPLLSSVRLSIFIA